MNFDDLQVIWSSQEEQPMFAIDRNSLQSLVQRRTSSIETCVKRFEWTMIGAPLALAIILPIDAWREGGGWDQYIVAAICFVVGMMFLVDRLSRAQSPFAFDRSLKGAAEHGLVQIDRHRRRLTVAFWGFHLPIAISAAIGLTVYSNVRTPLIWAGVLLVTGISFWGIQRDAQKKLQEKRELQQLLAKLDEAEQQEVVE